MNRNLRVWLVCLAAAVVQPLAWQSARADEPVSPEQLVRDYDRLQRHRFYRHGSSVFDNVARFAQADEAKIIPADRFLRAFYESRWDEVRVTLASLPAELGAAIYDKILADLTDRQVPVLTLDDVVGIADACPAGLTSPRIRTLGLLLRVAVPKEQEIWLKKALDQGTHLLGGEESNRLATGRILLHADFDDLAREYLPDPLQANEIEDPEVRDEVLNFLASQEEIQSFQQTRLAALWEKQARVLGDPQADLTRTQQAADQLAELLGRATTAAIEPWLRSMLRGNPGGALRLAAALGKRAHGKTADKDTLLRANYLKAQQTLLRCAGEVAELGEMPWQPVARTMADSWIQEAEHTFNVAPGYRSSGVAKPFLLPGDLLDTAPDAAWLAALPASLQSRVDVCISKAVLVSDRYQEAVALIVGIADRNPSAGRSLAEEYLKAWAYRHDPQVPEAVRKKYLLASDARIMVSPIMMEKNIASLAQMMDAFRQHGIRPRNGALLVDAFAVCYSQADVYRRSHIEQVFGPIEGMDEDIFLQLIRTMTAGLGSRWRSIELQDTSGTRRTQEETLQMVRGGYQAALEMIDQRFAARTDAWRVLMLGGSLLSDWGQFEYSQQLVAESNLARMEAYQANSNRAEEYFARAAEVYAVQVPGLRPNAYSIDLYLGWFHSLLGIDTNGEMRLAKPLDRSALNRLREQLRGLPGPAGSAHIDRFARQISSRIEDTERPLHESLKYKYLAGSLVITQESPFSFQAREKVDYYDQLLDEIRLETRVDGSSTIHRDHEFGILLTVRHTEAMGRMADFGKYLVNEPPPASPPGRPAVATANSRTAAVQGRRDALELNIREVLSLFFDVKSVTFSPRDVQPRATERPGWGETVLAYIHARALDASVDKIPRIQMSLEFLDVTGPVAISAESAETMIKVTDEPVPPRPVRQLDLAQLLDARNLAATGELLLEVTASANGLLPELDLLVNVEALNRQLPIVRIDPHEGTLVRELNSWAEEIHAVSERRWTVALDASSLLDPPRRIALQMPASRRDDASVAYQMYRDMDLIDLDDATCVVGLGEGDAAAPSESTIPAGVWYAGGAGGVALLGLLALLSARWPGRGAANSVRARDVFRMPAEVDGFVVVQLLRSLAASPLVQLSQTQRSELLSEMQQVQQVCFGSQAAGLSEQELRAVAGRWLKIALS